MKLLIDADYIVYKCCAAAESEIDFGDDVIVVTSKFSEAYGCVKRELKRISSRFGHATDLILFFSDGTNFRKKILPEYKGHRNRKKPCGYKRIINQLRTEYEVIVMPTCEADDALGIYATKYPGNVIVSPDKDMRQIPGTLFDMENSTLITAEDGAKWHLIQTMAGDNTDGYSGVPGVGVKRATSIFKEKGWSWKTVCETFYEKGYTPVTAIANARLARILTTDDWDYEKKEPILWSPTKDYEIK